MLRSMAPNRWFLLLLIAILPILHANAPNPSITASSSKEIVSGSFNRAYPVKGLSSVRDMTKTVAIASAGTSFQLIRWKVMRQPNEHKLLVITINGNSPGPLIQVRQGEGIRLFVTNSLEHPQDSIAITWEGLQLIETPGCDDGTILPGHTCIYHFVAGLPGNYLYRSKYPTQKMDGLWGKIHILPQGSL